MSLAKMAAGEGYEYYLRNIATHDADERGEQALSDYYTERGESPGRWWGAGLDAVDITAGEEVTESQMWALFGRGLHPNAEALIADRVAELIAEGVSPRVARAAALLEVARIGTPFAAVTVDELSYRAECRRAYEKWNESQGRDPGAPVPDEVREVLATEVAETMFLAEYGREPLTETELSAWVAQASRPSSKAVAGFDLTFSPVKSVSMLWALAPTEVATVVEAAHHAAVVDALTFLESHATYTRVGRGGVAQVEVDGLLATMFDHRDSRAGDPDLHTHVVISNKVRRRDGSGWGALDGRMLYRHAVTASEIYNTRLEHHLETTLGVVFTERDQVDAHKRPVREIVGASPELAAVWSTRSKAINRKLAELSRKFQADHGREPGPKELLRLSQEATLSTRGGKHHARSVAEQRAEWRAEAAHVLGGEEAVDDMVTGMLAGPVPERDTAESLPVREIAAQVVATVAEQRATWQAHHIRAETARRLRGRITPADFDQALTDVVDTALTDPQSIPRHRADPTPPTPGLTRSDGASVYTTAESTHYTSPQIIAAEKRLLAAAQLDGARTLPATVVDLAVVEYAANGHELNPGQVALVSAFAGSGRRFQVAVAPAGTGKTTTMRVLTNAWTAHEGEGTVLGFAPTASAAAQLATDSGAPAHTVDLLLTYAEHLTDGTDPEQIPEWVRAIGEHTLVLIDEAAKTSTLKLDALVRFLAGRGATIRAIGDDRQLAAVQAGGIVRDIVETTTPVTLSKVVRFRDHGEAAASLALRDGDPAGLAFHFDQDRIRTGTLTDAVHSAFRAWRVDYAQGRDVALLAPTRALVGELNALARTERLHRAERAGLAVGPEVLLADELSASAGDVITTRRNNRALRISGTDYVRNGYRWQVQAVHADGQVTATHLGSGRRITLPADYVRDHVTLGYATTIDSAQGLTVDHCHGVLTGTESRAQLYVMATRGRASNHLYVNTTQTSDEQALHTYTAVHPPTALDVLTGILSRETPNTSAASDEQAATDPARLLGPAVDAYLHALGHIADTRLTPRRRDEITAAAQRLAPGVIDAPAWPVLAGHLALLELSGGDAITALQTAVAARELGTADDIAAVLDWRIDPTGRHTSDGTEPLSWLPAIPAAIGESSPDHAHLTARAAQIRDYADQIATRARTAEPADTPLWASRLHAIDPHLVTELAVWRAAVHVPDNDRRPTGPPRYPAAERREQARLDALVTDRIGDLDIHTRRWHSLSAALDERLTTDPYWPVLAAEFSGAHAAGVDVRTHAGVAVRSRPLPTEQPAAALRWRLAEYLDRDREPEFVDLVTELRADPLRALRDADIEGEATSRVRRARGHAHRLAASVGGSVELERAEKELESYWKWQARIDERAAAVLAHPQAQAAIEAREREVARARDQHADADRALKALRWHHTSRTRDQRREHYTQTLNAISDAIARLGQARDEQSRIRRVIDAPESNWKALLAQAADTAARERGRALAEQRVAESEQKRDQITAQVEEWHAWARQPGSERRRRAALPAEQREREDRARTEIHDHDHPLPSREDIARQQEQRRLEAEAEAEAAQDTGRDYPIYQPDPPSSGIGL